MAVCGGFGDGLGPRLKVVGDEGWEEPVGLFWSGIVRVTMLLMKLLLSPNAIDAVGTIKNKK